MTTPPTSLPRAGLAKRLAALVYDALVLAGLLMFAVALSMGFAAYALGLTDPEALRRYSSHPLHQLYFMLIWFGYYGLSWTRAGQTVGMRAWRLKVLRLDGGLMNWRDSALRFAAGCLGLANLSLLLDRSGLALHDKLSRTEVLQRPKAR